MRQRTTIFFRISAIATIVAAVLYCSWPLGFWLNPIAMRTGLASELGAYGQPYNWLFIAADIASGVLLLGATLVLNHVYQTRGAARWMLNCLAVYGVCGALDAALPMHCLPSIQTCGPVFKDPLLILHGAFDWTGSMALIGTVFAALRWTRSHDRKWRLWLHSIGWGGVLFALASAALYLTGGPGYWAQRYYITLSCIWVATLPFVLRPRRTLAYQEIRQ